MYCKQIRTTLNNIVEACCLCMLVPSYFDVSLQSTKLDITSNIQVNLMIMFCTML